MEIMTGKLAIGASFLLISLLFGQLAWISPASDETNLQRFEEKANLALRRTGHRLLLASGDSTSRIPAVKRLDDNTYTLELSKSFNYSQLPSELQESLDLHGIKNNYDVAVVDCKTNELQLGYNFLDYSKSKSKEVACVGREQLMGCYKLKITFAAPKNAPASLPLWGTLGLGLAFIGITYVVFRKRKSEPAPIVETPKEATKSATRIHFGESNMDLENQMLYTANSQHNLTYREAKLLHLFIRHQNQVLERDFILKSVWEDEGVTVGRSIDVFVSRLRKLLQEDTSLKIAAVHGVGYRLEVNTSNNA